MVQLKCERCGISFEREKRQRFCGKSCSAQWRMSRPEFVASLQTSKRSEVCRQAMLRLRSNPEAMKYKRVQAKDLKKTRFLEARGWTVLRFRNAEVLEDLPAVISRIRQASLYSTSKQRLATISPTAS